jgi:hypothetical protein
VADLLRAGGQQHVAVLLLTAVTEALEQVLRHDAQLALRAADRLLQHPPEDGIGLVDAHGVRQITMMEEHRAPLDGVRSRGCPASPAITQPALRQRRRSVRKVIE